MSSRKRGPTINNFVQGTEKLKRQTSIEKYLICRKMVIDCTRCAKKDPYGINLVLDPVITVIIKDMHLLPDRTMQMAAKALILRACISLWEHRTSTHMSRNPIPNRLMYMNSAIIDNHRTPAAGKETHMSVHEKGLHVLIYIYKLCLNHFYLYTHTLDSHHESLRGWDPRICDIVLLWRTMNINSNFQYRIHLHTAWLLKHFWCTHGFWWHSYASIRRHAHPIHCQLFRCPLKWKIKGENVLKKS